MKYDYRFYGDFMDKIDVVCPRCKGHGIIKTLSAEDKKIRFICEECGLIKDKKKNGKIFFTNKARFNESAMEGNFNLPLWYQINVGVNLLSALNMRHLNFLENYISDTLRERQEREGKGWSNKSIQSRMPRWMIDSKNRELIIKKIRKLKEKY